MLSQERFYGRAVAALKRDKIPFLLGGAYGLRHYTGILRDTKDLDVFLRAEDYPAAMRTLAEEGFPTELTDAQWLAKAFDPMDGHFVDLIFSSGNGLCPVDDLWFNHAERGEVFGQVVHFVPPEEMVFSKAFIMARDRYDGADVAHLFLLLGRNMDWKRLVWRFGTHWRVLLNHLVLFPYIYPSELECIPAGVMHDLLTRALTDPGSRLEASVCQGHYLDRTCYQVDCDQWGYQKRAG